MSKKNKPQFTEDELDAIISTLTEEQWQAVIQLFHIEEWEAVWNTQLKEVTKFHEGMVANRARMIEALARRHPERVKHLKWQRWKKKDGLSYQDIVDKHKDETGEEVTRDAVIKALSRLPKEEEFS